MCHYRLGDATKARECFERAKATHERNAKAIHERNAAQLSKAQSFVPVSATHERNPAHLSKAELEELEQILMEAETLLEKR